MSWQDELTAFAWSCSFSHTIWRSRRVSRACRGWPTKSDSSSDPMGACVSYSSLRRLLEPGTSGLYEPSTDHRSATPRDPQPPRTLRALFPVHMGQGLLLNLLCSSKWPCVGWWWHTPSVPALRRQRKAQRLTPPGSLSQVPRTQPLLFTCPVMRKLRQAHS